MSNGPPGVGRGQSPTPGKGVPTSDIFLAYKTKFDNDMKITFDTLKRSIAHEWGHYLAFHLMGYGKWNEGFEIEMNICGLYGHTRNFATLFKLIPDSDLLVDLYSGPIAEGLYCGHPQRIEYTDAQEVQRIAPSRAERDKARKRALELLTPFSGVITELVNQTLERNAYSGEIDFTDFYDRIHKDEALQYLNTALIKNGKCNYE